MQSARVNPDMGCRSYRALSALLGYPDAALIGGLDEIASVLAAEAIIPAVACDALIPLIDTLRRNDLLDLQSEYVSLFYRSLSLSLHLYEHVHGESRDRGQAMVDLAQLYARHGLEIDTRELPDYLPLYLEFLSQRPADDAAGLLALTGHILEALRRRLEDKGSPYAAVFAALLAVAATQPAENQVQSIMGVLGPDADSPEALDRAWEEEAVTFMAAGGAAGAPPCGAAA